MAKYEYEERRTFAELAGDVGLARAKRELQYPSSWSTGKKWCEEFGIEIELDELKAKAASFNSFYEETELRIVQQDLIIRALELMEDSNLTAEKLDKIAATIKKATDSIQMLRGKATSRTAVEDTLEVDAIKLYDDWKASTAGDAA